MKRLSTKSVLFFAVVLALFAVTMVPAQAQAGTDPLTLELDLTQLPSGDVPRDGLAYNSFLTLSSVSEDAQIIDDEFDTGAIGLFPGQIFFDFDSDRVQVLSFSYDVTNFGVTSAAFASGSAGAGVNLHPDGPSSQSFENLGAIDRIEMTGLETVVGNIVIEFTGNSPDDDSDGDGVQDGQDNCTVVANPDQRDTDEDGYGNRCDTDLNNDNIVNFFDVAMFRDAFVGDGKAPHADFDGDEDVDFDDFDIMKAAFLTPPGPSAIG